MKTVLLFTDGACSGNPGPGGWGAVLIFGKHMRKISGYEENTTNNRMELTAVIRGLQALKQKSQVELTTDSLYVKKAFTDGWLNSWQKNNWRTAGKDPVKNQDLWQELLALEREHAVRWHWVKGHSGHVYNTICDELARQAIVEKRGIDERSEMLSELSPE